jgi:hypothetical protein
MKKQIGFYLFTYQRERRLANLVVVSAESLTEARLRSAPGLGDAILDQVLPLEAEIAAALPPDLIGKVLTSQAAMTVLHDVADGPSRSMTGFLGRSSLPKISAPFRPCCGADLCAFRLLTFV